jgi:hypothetical protein
MCQLIHHEKIVRIWSSARERQIIVRVHYTREEPERKFIRLHKIDELDS